MILPAAKHHHGGNFLRLPGLDVMRVYHSVLSSCWTRAASYSYLQRILQRVPRIPRPSRHISFQKLCPVWMIAFRFHPLTDEAGFFFFGPALLVFSRPQKRKGKEKKVKVSESSYPISIFAFPPDALTVRSVCSVSSLRRLHMHVCFEDRGVEIVSRVERVSRSAVSVGFDRFRDRTGGSDLPDFCLDPIRYLLLDDVAGACFRCSRVFLHMRGSRSGRSVVRGFLAAVW
ncbi:hypothetical protein ACLOJK_034670 [Asimina triloba]